MSRVSTQTRISVDSVFTNYSDAYEEWDTAETVECRACHGTGMDRDEIYECPDCAGEGEIPVLGS